LVDENEPLQCKEEAKATDGKWTYPLDFFRASKRRAKIRKADQKSGNISLLGVQGDANSEKSTDATIYKQDTKH